jgi:glycosyltransferase involved in cell wall biosynthesis
LRDSRGDAERFARNAAAVFAGNGELARFASEARGGGGRGETGGEGASEGVHLVPTVIDTERFRPKEEGDDRREGEGAVHGRALVQGRAIVVGWVGTHTTAAYLGPIVPTLRKLMEEVAFTVRIISNRPPDWLGDAGRGFEFVPWSGDHEVDRIREFSIGLYPLADTPWERGKCGLKAIQYMACGVPVVGSRVGVLGQLVPDGEAGLLLDPGADWGEALRRLLLDPGLRRTMGSKGRVQAVSRYSVASLVDRVASILMGVAGRSS